MPDNIQSIKVIADSHFGSLKMGRQWVSRCYGISILLRVIQALKGVSGPATLRSMNAGGQRALGQAVSGRKK